MNTSYAFEPRIGAAPSTAQKCAKKYIEDRTEAISRKRASTKIQRRESRGVWFWAKSSLARLTMPGLRKRGA